MICFAFCKNGVNLAKIKRAKIIIFTKKRSKNGQKSRQKTRSKQKCQKMEIIKTQILKFSQKTHQKTPLFKTLSVAFLDKNRQNPHEKQQAIRSALPLLFTHLRGNFDLVAPLRWCQAAFFCARRCFRCVLLLPGTSFGLLLHFPCCFCVLLALYSAI